MIPVRIPATMMPVLADERRFTIAADHPLAAEFCPACDRSLSGCVTVLVAVAVHAACAGVPEEEPQDTTISRQPQS